MRKVLADASTVAHYLVNRHVDGCGLGTVFKIGVDAMLEVFRGLKQRVVAGECLSRVLFELGSWGNVGRVIDEFRSPETGLIGSRRDSLPGLSPGDTWRRF